MLIAAGGAALFAYMVWSSYHVEISYYGLRFSWQLLAPFDQPWGPAFVGRWRGEAAALAANPAAVPVSDLIDCLNHAGYFFVGVPILMAINGFRKATRHRSNITRRRIDATTLPRVMSAHAPAVIPSLYYGEPGTLLLNVDPVEHRSAENPEEWVARHALLAGGALDRTRCRELLIGYLGQRIGSLEELKPHERALFAVFGARLLSNNADIGLAQELLDALNRSCHTHTFEGKPGYPDLTLTDAAFRRYASTPLASDWLRRHPYPRTMLHSMHKQTDASGSLPSAHFRWLKGMDRELWYALNTTGRKTPFLESAAVFTQAKWEGFAFECGYRLTEPNVDDAVDGVERYLIKVGLMRPVAKKTPPPAPRPTRSATAPAAAQPTKTPGISASTPTTNDAKE